MTGSNAFANNGAIPITDPAIARAADILRAGGIVAVPTETVYGLAGDASNANAVAAIYHAKGRPDFNPLIVHVADLVSAKKLAIFDARAEMISDAYWPGPLTMVLPLRDDAPVAAAVTAGLPTIALRCPAHPAMRRLLGESGLNLAAPSANRSGTISPTIAAHVQSSLGDDVPMILDGGPCEAGLESTIIALRVGRLATSTPRPRYARIIVRGVGFRADTGQRWQNRSARTACWPLRAVQAAAP